MNNAYWRNGEYIAARASRPATETLEIVRKAQRLRSRYLAMKTRKALRALLWLPFAAGAAAARLWRNAAQPWRIDGNRLGFGNRR